MNKQELIKKWESKEGVPSYEISAFPVNPSLNEIYVAGYGVARKEILEDLKQLDKPKKVIFSHEEEFVANWLDGLKGEISDKKLSSGAAFMVFVGQQLECLYYNEYTLITDDVEGWLLHPENKVRLLNAIDNGYEVEKEPTYVISIPNNSFYKHYLARFINNNFEKPVFRHIGEEDPLFFKDKTKATVIADWVKGTVEKWEEE
ncbi:DUF1642 domain-containing protein [Enterococcus faecalis]|uniref:DUF1642 domain-containing protein n=1 Tax=Enterococcus faecalis TaxID=1351 RepID=UPI00247A7CA2|nr:DUF1642 domain-containing protein [Enterococcus faecalis]MDH7585894.1 DUF1642 domain-containing protein [Enterococcus faecalis]